MSCVRTLRKSAPGVYIDGDEAEFGNPMLKPLESSNFDLGVEKYFGKASMVSFYSFYKDIDNFIYNTNIAGTGQWADFDEAVTYKMVKVPNSMEWSFPILKI